MSKYAEVIIDIAYNKLDRPFTYKVPGRMQDVLQPGSLVMVPFGKADTIRKGYVIALKDECGYDPVYANEDPNRILPVDVLRKLEKEGVIGKLHNLFYSTVGNGTAVASARNYAKEIVRRLLDAGVNAVILTST